MTPRALRRELLDDLWNEGNLVMPGAYRVREVRDLMIGGPPNNCSAIAESIGPLKAGTLIAYGNSPTHAVRQLVQMLKARRDGE